MTALLQNWFEGWVINRKTGKIHIEVPGVNGWRRVVFYKRDFTPKQWRKVVKITQVSEAALQALTKPEPKSLIDRIWG